MNTIWNRNSAERRRRHRPSPVQEEALACRAGRTDLPNRCDGQFVVQAGVAAQRAGTGRPNAAEHEGEAADVEAEHAQRIDHEVHGHGVRGVLGAAQAGFHQREAGLHEHDQEAGDQRPHEVDRDAVVADGVRQLHGQRLRLGLRGVIVERLLGVVVGGRPCSCPSCRRRSAPPVRVTTKRGHQLSVPVGAGAVAGSLSGGGRRRGRR